MDWLMRLGCSSNSIYKDVSMDGPMDGVGGGGK